jgi:hypothetical protein
MNPALAPSQVGTGTFVQLFAAIATVGFSMTRGLAQSLYKCRNSILVLVRIYTSMLHSSPRH